MTWLDRSAIHFLKEMVAVGFDPSAAASIRFEALRWLLSRAMPKEGGAGEISGTKNSRIKGPRDRVVYTSTQGSMRCRLAPRPFIGM